MFNTGANSSEGNSKTNILDISGLDGKTYDRLVAEKAQCTLYESFGSLRWISPDIS